MVDAYEDGLADGLNWDLDGFETREHLLATPGGWDEETINARGRTACAERWGVEPEGDGWDNACARYNRGCYEGATAPQSERTGLPPADYEAE